jgi:hypothetical protein
MQRFSFGGLPMVGQDAKNPKIPCCRYDNNISMNIKVMENPIVRKLYCYLITNNIYLDHSYLHPVDCFLKISIGCLKCHENALSNFERL